MYTRTHSHTDTLHAQLHSPFYVDHYCQVQLGHKSLPFYGLGLTSVLTPPRLGIELVRLCFKISGLGLNLIFTLQRLGLDIMCSQ